MLKRILRTAIITFMCNALVYTPLLRAEQLSLPSGDLVAPEITQEVYKQSVAPDSDHEITVKVTDEFGVKQVVLYYRVIDKSSYQRRAMKQIGATDDYMAKVYADEIESPGIEYYIEARDLAGNTLLHGGDFAPISVSLESGEGQPAGAETSTTPDTAGTTPEPEKKGVSKWVWIGLGVLAVGAVAAAGGSSGGDSAAPPPAGTATLSVTAPEPTN